MKEMILVEYGSSYSSDPWTPKCVCPTESDAKDYIARQSQLASLYHTSKLPVEGEEQIDKQSEYEYIEDLIEAAKDLVNYFQYHNKNLTKAQDDKIDAVAETLRLIELEGNL